MEFQQLSELQSALVFLAAVGCGTDKDVACENAVQLSSTQCHAALRFASRDATNLLPAADAVSRYFDRWWRASEAEPILSQRAPQRYRTSDFDAELITSNATVIAAWTEGVLETGDAQFDQIITELGPATPWGPYRLGHDNGDGTYSFPIVTPYMFNEDVLQQRLMSASTRLPEPFHRTTDDGTWSWDEAPPGSAGSDADTARISFTFGWGDCFTGCRYFHSLLAVVPVAGEAVVYDEGGDDLPPELQLSPNTIPSAPK